MKRVVLIGDSLGMPREGLKREETYPYLIKSELTDFDIVSIHARANDSGRQSTKQSLRESIDLLQPDVIVIQLGIVDCAPRLFTRMETHFVRYLLGVRTFIRKFMSKRRHFFTKLLPKTYVKKADFEKNILKIVERGREYDASVLVVNIANTSERNKERSYGFEKNILAYNNILQEIVNDNKLTLIDMYSMNCKEIMLEDGIHYNQYGSQVLAGKIVSYLQK